MTSTRDTAFVSAVTLAAERFAEEVSGAGPDSVFQAPLGPHRQAMLRVKLFVALFLAPDSTWSGDVRAIEAATDYVSVLESLQLPSGLFRGGDNVESPPDSGFTVNDLGDTMELIYGASPEARAGLEGVEARLRAIAEAAAPAMLTGGVHTPNHRWELASALCRLFRITGKPELRDRAESWLAEGIDIDADGQYSERSANYAVHVSNPSLLLIADVLDRPELRAHVERNLDSFLALIREDGSIETVHSRRQDQNDLAFSVAPFAMHYRRFAIEQQRGDFSWAVERAVQNGIAEPQTALTELLLVPALCQEMPEPIAPGARQYRWTDSGLVVDSSPERTLVISGVTDYPALRRIRSGMANNPTFLRMFAGAAVLNSVRISRNFFGLGPFRPDIMSVDAASISLEETVAGAYYQPLRADDRRADGLYALVDEGRFTAAMSFDRRDTDQLELRTVVRLAPREDGINIEIIIDGPVVPWAVELAFAPGGAFESVDGGALGSESFTLTEGSARYRVGKDSLRFGPGTGSTVQGVYRPGEDYDYLGGTDGVAGPRAYITGTAPGRVTIELRAEH